MNLQNQLVPGKEPHQQQLTNFNFYCSGRIAVSGATTMRVTQQEQGSLPLDPCASFTWGSVVEFSIFITGGIDCTGFDGDNSTEAIVVPVYPLC